MENHDITLKNLLIVAFLILGLFTWSRVDVSFSFDRVKKLESPVSFNKSFERNPTATMAKVEKIVIQKNIISEYKPNLKVFDSKRIESPSNVVFDTKIPESSLSENTKTSDFEATRNEITVLMAAGKLDEALDLARSRLDENVSTSKEAPYMGYLQDFIMQNMHDPEEQYGFTFLSIKNAQDPAIRKQFIEKFSVYQPEMAEEMKQEIKSSGLTI